MVKNNLFEISTQRVQRAKTAILFETSPAKTAILFETSPFQKSKSFMFSLWNNLAHELLVFAVTVILVNTDLSFPDGTRVQTRVSFILTEVPPSCTGGGSGRC